jgi:hypothetical protein
MWERVESLSVEIKRQWCSGAHKENLSDIVQSLSSLRTGLRQWSKQHFGAVTTQLSQLHKEMETVKARRPMDQREIRAITDRMDELLYREEMWLQRSRISWLKEGDRNMRFFHMKAKWRARKNKVRKLRRNDGTWCDNLNEMKGMTRDFFC